MLIISSKKYIKNYGLRILAPDPSGSSRGKVAIRYTKEI